MMEFPCWQRTRADCDERDTAVGGAAAVLHGRAGPTQVSDMEYPRTPEYLVCEVQALADQSLHPRAAPPGLPFRLSEASMRGSRNAAIAEVQREGPP
jgi:hypothetical protein